MAIMSGHYEYRGIGRFLENKKRVSTNVSIATRRARLRYCAQHIGWFCLN
jgi:hypothetical protein